MQGVKALAKEEAAAAAVRARAGAGAGEGEGVVQALPRKYHGVRKRLLRGFTAEIRNPVERSRLWLGTFDTAEEAAWAYDTAARTIQGHRAKPNFSQPPPLRPASAAVAVPVLIHFTSFHRARARRAPATRRAGAGGSGICGRAPAPAAPAPEAFPFQGTPAPTQFSFRPASIPAPVPAPAPKAFPFQGAPSPAQFSFRPASAPAPAPEAFPFLGAPAPAQFSFRPASAPAPFSLQRVSPSVPAYPFQLSTAPFSLQCAPALAPATAPAFPIQRATAPKPNPFFRAAPEPCICHLPVEISVLPTFAAPEERMLARPASSFLSSTAESVDASSKRPPLPKKPKLLGVRTPGEYGSMESVVEDNFMDVTSSSSTAAWMPFDLNEPSGHGDGAQ